MIHIRKAIASDIDAIMACYDAARQYMRRQGNNYQWTNGYPSRQLVADDIAAGTCFVGVDDNDEIAMVFAFIIGPDPTYAVIEEGRWLNDQPYGTIHRLGSTGKHHGILRRCVEFCMSQTDNLRLDTHEVNLTMQRAAAKLGFRRCGIIYCNDGTPRIAYHKLGESQHGA